MNDNNEEKYEDWTIRVIRRKSMESRFSFEIIDSFGRVKHVDPGGDSREEAIKQARQMIDKINTGSKYGVS